MPNRLDETLTHPDLIATCVVVGGGKAETGSGLGP
jgi:hypothetical protein